MVVEREKLFSQRYFEGFLPLSEFDYESLILKNYEYRQREDVEKNERFKQPISYALILNRDLQKVFTHFRNGGDSRLNGFWTLGIMEHIEPKDEVNRNPLYSGCVRGILEETDFENPEPELSGYVNVDVGDVNRVHFGLIYIVQTKLTKINLRDKKLKDGDFKSLEEIKKLKENSKIEYWAPFCLDLLSDKLRGSS